MKKWECCLESLGARHLGFLGGRGAGGKHRFEVEAKFKPKGVHYDVDIESDGSVTSGFKCCDPALCDFTQWIRGGFWGFGTNGGFTNASDGPKGNQLITPLAWADDGYDNEVWELALGDITRVYYTDSPGSGNFFKAGVDGDFWLSLEFKLEVKDIPTGKILGTKRMGVAISGIKSGRIEKTQDEGHYGFD